MAINHPLARRTDPATSHDAIEDVKPRLGTQMWLLLVAYIDAGPLGLTADEAGRRADLSHTGYWKRCSDLYRGGLIDTVWSDGEPLTRPGRTGSCQEVRAVTREGLRWYLSHAPVGDESYD